MTIVYIEGVTVRQMGGVGREARSKESNEDAGSSSHHACILKGLRADWKFWCLTWI